MNEYEVKSASIFAKFAEKLGRVDLRAAVAIPAVIGAGLVMAGVAQEVHGQAHLLDGGASQLMDYKETMRSMQLSLGDWVTQGLLGKLPSFGGDMQARGLATATVGPVLSSASVLLARGFTALKASLLAAAEPNKLDGVFERLASKRAISRVFAAFYRGDTLTAKEIMVRHRLDTEIGDPATPLTHAVRHKDHALIEHLIGRRANVNAVRDGMRPIHAVKDLHSFALLSSAGADVNAATERGGPLGPAGTTLLHAACRDGNLELVWALLATGGIDVNARDENRYTPLHYAATKDARFTRALIEAGANRMATTSQGFAAQTLMSMAGTSPEATYAMARTTSAPSLSFS